MCHLCHLKSMAKVGATTSCACFHQPPKVIRHVVLMAFVLGSFRLLRSMLPKRMFASLVKRAQSKLFRLNLARPTHSMIMCCRLDCHHHYHNHSEMFASLATWAQSKLFRLNLARPTQRRMRCHQRKVHPPEHDLLHSMIMCCHHHHSAAQVTTGT